MSVLRGYQQDIVNRCDDAWHNRGVMNVMPVCATGSGKTVMMTDVAARHDGYGAAIAHRGQLVGQISLALARAGVQHDIVASKAVVRTIAAAHLEDIGRCFYNPSANWRVASVDTLPNRRELTSWMNRVTLGFIDEGHHVLASNKWGRAVGMFPNARWMFPTATPLRADGKGLGRDYDGLTDEIIEGPPMRWLIDNGYLTDYIVRAPIPSDLDMSDVTVGANGEYNQKQSQRAVKRSRKIVGSVVDTYLQHTAGKLGIVFAVDVEHAQDLVKGFLTKGVPCELITAESSEEDRRAIMRRYRERETLVLVNVDLFGEGFDLPTIEVVMFARPTASFSLYSQQWGRALRLMLSPLLMAAWDTYTPAQRLAMIAQSAKPVAFIHDHVGNIIHFMGPPDKPRDWSLEPANKRRSSGAADAIPLRVCVNPMCNQPYERFYPACPYCGQEPPIPEKPSGPQQVDGDITLYTAEMLRELFGVDTVEKVLAMADSSFVPIPVGASQRLVYAKQAQHRQKQQAQQQLRETMKIVMPTNDDERINNRRFFLRYGVDVLQAKLMGTSDATALAEKIVDSVSKKR